MNDHASKLAELQLELGSRNLDGFVIPLTDEHNSEYVADYAQRLRWLTGFTGSAGTAVVLSDKAAVFVDGRYTLQAAEQVDGELFDHESLHDTPPVSWAIAKTHEGARIGYDPFLHSGSWLRTAKHSASAKGVVLVATPDNPVDAVWPDQPQRPKAAAFSLADLFTGKSSPEKRADISGQLDEMGADAAVLSSLDSIAWVFNIRGGDVRHTPVAIAYSILHADGTADLFIDPDKVDDELAQHLGNAVRISPYEQFLDGLSALGKAGETVWIDPDTASAAMFNTLEESGARIIKRQDPCTLPKAIKNPAELSGSKSAHRRDGAVLTRFLYWLSVEAPKGDLDELSVAGKLLQMREGGEHFRDLSFGTISGAAGNGANPHYSVTSESNRRLNPGDLYLVDSGGQYLDGTTDVTRTIAVGEAGDEEKRHFTLVLKGHIALGTATFPNGTTGSQLDGFARRPLWEAGLDYDHGTGHGVGSFLGVHEGPQRISKLPSTVPLAPGMILSNEPGYYKAGEYGIRIENLVFVKKVEIPGAEREMLGFEDLTLAPIDRNLIDVSLLDTQELSWLNDYHARVRKEIGPHLKGDILEWFGWATEAL